MMNIKCKYKLLCLIVFFFVFTPIVKAEPQTEIITLTSYEEQFITKAELLTLTSKETNSFWQSPLVPIGMSVIIPGSGQIYQGGWFNITRGVLYLGILGIGWWQMFDNINNQNPAMTNVWSGVLIGINILSPMDAWMFGKSE